MRNVINWVFCQLPFLDLCADNITINNFHAKTLLILDDRRQISRHGPYVVVTYRKIIIILSPNLIIYKGINSKLIYNMEIWSKKLNALKYGRNKTKKTTSTLTYRMSFFYEFKTYLFWKKSVGELNMWYQGKRISLLLNVFLSCDLYVQWACQTDESTMDILN